MEQKQVGVFVCLCEQGGIHTQPKREIDEALRRDVRGDVRICICTRFTFNRLNA